MAQMIPFIMNPETRKVSSHLGKILLVFGVLGVGIIAFIFLGKMFKPLEAIGKFFKKAFKGVGGFFGDVFKDVGGFFGGILSIGKKKKVVSLEKWAEEQDIKKPEVHAVIKAHYYGGEGEGEEQARREFRRYSTLVVRKLAQLKTAEGIPDTMSARISMVESAFRHVDKGFVRDIPKHFEHVFDRKKTFLQGNLISGLQKVELREQQKEFERKGMYTASRLGSKGIDIF